MCSENNNNTEVNLSVLAECKLWVSRAVSIMTESVISIYGTVHIKIAVSLLPSALTLFCGTCSWFGYGPGHDLLC